MLKLAGECSRFAMPAWLAVAAAGSAAQTPTGPSLEELTESLVPYAKATDAVTLPDRRELAFVCMGEGTPTVILTPGAGTPAFSWGTVQPGMAKTTRVCAWDRPGFGLSDGSASPQNVGTTTADLEAALATGRIPGPYVLVGHSLGSYESMLFADRHPDRTVGMVLVDPSIPDQFAIIDRVAPQMLSAGEGQENQMLGVFRACAEQIRSGALRAGGPDPNNCVTYPPIFPKALKEALAAKVLGNPLQYESQASFLSNTDESSRLVINPERHYGDMPLIVLTATVEPPPPPGAPAELAAAREAWTAEWDRGHDHLAALSTRGVNARVPGANHNMQGTKPQVVIDAVEAVVAEARAAMASSTNAPQAAAAQAAEAPVPVPREVLERYVGRYELNGTIATVGVTEDGRLTVRLAGQPEGPPLRAVSANEFVADAAGVRLFFEGDGPKADRIRSHYNGGEVVGTRIADDAAPVSLLASEQPASPSTSSGSARSDEPGASHPAARLVVDWLNALQTMDDPALVAFMQAHTPGIPGTPEQWLAGRQQLRGLRFHSVMSTNADRAELWLFDENIDSFVSATATVRADDPAKLATLALQPTNRLPPGAEPPPKLEGAALIEAVRGRAARYAESDDFSGAVLIAKGGQVLLEEAYGFADREARKPNGLDTQFRFGSMGKMFAAVAIMQLVEGGKVDLSAPIGRYLAGYPNQDTATKVTVANLLTHTGGTGDIFGPQFQANRASLRDLTHYVDLYGERSPQFEPGSRYAYSNYGFILLGRIVEEVSGLGYDQYLQQNIFDPAEMRSTGHLPESASLPQRAVAYMGFGSNLKRADETLPVRGTSAGGGYSTVGDLQRFIDAVVSHRLLEPGTLQTLISGGITTQDGNFHAYDFGGTVEGTGQFIGHGGGAPGMNGNLQHFLDSGYTVIVLANRDPPAAMNISMFAARRLPTE